MALNNVDSSNGYLQATADGGYAISSAINQDTGENDFNSVKNIRTLFRFKNISNSVSGDTDLLKTGTPLQNGDKLIIVKDDDSIHELTVGSGLNVTTANVVPDMTSDTAPEGDVTYGSRDGSHYGWNAFDRNTETFFWSDTGGKWLQYQFENNTPKRITKYFMLGVDSNDCFDDWDLMGSTDGTNYVTISEERDQQSTLRNAFNNGRTYIE